LRNAETNARRYAGLVSKDYVTREQYDKFVSDAEVARANVAADRAAVQNARLNLSYCEIRAPMDGRTGNLMAHRGDLVKANDTTALVTINQITPVYVEFSVPEAVLQQVRAHDRPESIVVNASARAGGPTLGQGRLSFVDNSIDPSTGTIALKATFPNLERGLWPGQYVDVSMHVADRPGAIVVPLPALQTGQEGQFVYVVNGSAVELRPVTVFKTVENEAIIEHGLRAGETVVTDGQLRLTPKSTIKVKGPA
ncbi:MAG: efflux RND transporter periplasmic adaptor subunit, partial [Acidobacteriota bacterium]